ncbi:acyltransferase [Kocuria rhizophila]|uniref:acyltransferase family protein n=1 Tax=Kocuria rhizophila TaxID=72000 RepID=UPI0025B2143E|nr:acyltransferase [Kocuria rhizophila]MDN3226199.1 acyltransferase [Kocuria rhizophila]
MSPPPPGPRARTAQALLRPARATLGDGLGNHDNALNFVRLVLAVVVIIVHAAPLGGFPDLPWHFLSGTAVNGFFAISGFLIAGSSVQTSLTAFVWRRLLRIFPAYWTTLVLTAFVVAPVAGAVGHERWDGGSAVSYVVDNAALRIHQWHIEDLLHDVPYPEVWNGSLWSLEYEGLAYIVAGLLLGVAAVRRRPLPWLAALLLTVLCLQVLAFGALDIASSHYRLGLRLAGFFLAGMVLWAARHRVRVTWWLAVPAVVVVCAGRWMAEPWGWTLTALPVAYVVLWLGAVLPLRIGARNDLSYGAYIYAFPLQQLLVVSGAASVLGYWAFCAVSVAVTLPVAWLSWTLLEKPALQWKTLVR